MIFVNKKELSNRDRKKMWLIWLLEEKDSF